MVSFTELSQLSTVSKIALVIATPISLGIVRLLEKYVRFVFNPLKKALPGPDCGFWFGQFFVIRKEPFMQPHLRWIQDITGWNVPFIPYSAMFGRSTLLLLDKDIVKEVLTAPYGKEPLRFVKDVRFLKNVLGEGLVTAEGEDWMRHRQIIQPAFFTQVLKESLNATVPSLTREFVEYWKTAAAAGREIDLNSHLGSLTLDIIGRVAFSHEFRALESVKTWANNKNASEEEEDVESEAALAEVDDPLIQALMHSFRFTWIGTISFILGLPWLSKYFNPVTVRTRAALDSAVDQVVANAKESLKENKEDKKKSLLHLLLEATERDSSEKKALNDVELRDEATTFIFAGHETTATWCYMAMYALVTYEGIQEKVYQDIQKHIPSGSSNEPIDLATVEKMEYFNAFLQEVLRLHPPVGMITRVASGTDHLGGHTIPKGTRLVISAYILHRHPNYWKDPETFDPERWLGDNRDDDKIRFAFLPFSAGGRNCIGQRFATVEAKLILAELIRSFVIELAPSQRDTKFTFSNMAVMRTKPRLRVVVKPRD